MRIVVGFGLIIEPIHAGASFGLDPFSVNVDRCLDIGMTQHFHDVNRTFASA
ncbi:conserved hypothetical protein [delta proteobacterium NaphS2]|nr:conserved hypothetical protein [delta proteobacterium NaphS2]